MGETHKAGSAILRILLVLLTVLFSAAILYRGNGTRPSAEPPEPSALSPDLTDSPAASLSPVIPTEAQMSLAPEPTPTPLPTETPEYRPIVYDTRSYQLVTDMVFAYRHQVQDREQIIAADVEALKAHDPRLGETWGGIMEYWDYVNSRMEIRFDRLPDDLPADDSLCIVVLGFQLEEDGSMSAEMLGRCELALTAANQYPRAYLLLTGGGTAKQHPEVTEAGVMAAWFRHQGILEERIILEDRSTTTEENAVFSLRILTERYPQIRGLVMVSSDYHLPVSCLLFTEAVLLYRCEYGWTPYEILDNLGLRGYGLNEYKNPAEQALYVWAVADPQT